MTMPYSQSRAIFEGNGAAVDFPFTFNVRNSSHLLLALTAPSGETTYPTCPTDWTATLSGTGGTVHFLLDNRPLPPGWKLAVARNMPFTQEIDLVSASRFDPQVIEDGLDQACAERQQLLEQLSRAVILSPTSDESPADVVICITSARDQAAHSAANAAASEAAAASSAQSAHGAALQAIAEADRATTQADRAQSLVEIGPATTKSLGFVQVGEGIAVTEGGVISVTPINLATRHTAGTVIVGEGLDIAPDGTLSAVIPPFFPAGGIVLWSGAMDAVPAGWALCDGENNTPDLRDRFVLGAGPNYAAGASGGSATASTSFSGSTGATTLAEWQMPSHAHGYTAPARLSSGPTDGGYAPASTSGATTGYSGSSGAHSHSMSASASVSTLPPYYALAYIMKLAEAHNA